MPDLIATQAMVELQGEWLDRIALRGENSDGGKIGDYSTTPTYFSQKSFIRVKSFNPKGKNSSNKKFKNGNDRKSMYLVGGYSEFRGIQSRENDFVNLKFGGSMLDSFRVYKFGEEVLFGNASAYENKKVEGNTERFGEWASLTEYEKEFLKGQITDQAIIVSKQ